MSLAALFYPVNLERFELFSLVHGFPVDRPLDVIEFARESGGEAQRELAVPFLAGMDGIEVTQARIALRCGEKLIDIEDYQTRTNGNQGMFLALPRAERLKKVELSFTPPTLQPGQTLRLVVRAASKSGSGFVAGAPLFGAPDLGQLGAMFGRVLGGMQNAPLGGNRFLVTLPSVLGEAWLFQVAVGNKAEDLSPLPVTLAINRVTVDAAPRNLTVTLGNAEGLLLWNNPEVLLPEAGEQDVSFTPLAQKHLGAALGTQNESTGTPALTLPVPLHFRSDSGGAVNITASELKAEYLVQPIGTLPLRLRVAGSRMPIVLSAPGNLRPDSSRLRLTVKHLGRELNSASGDSPIEPPATGLRIGAARQIATSIDVAPIAGAAAGSVLKLKSVRVYIAAPQAAEAVLEIRGDVAGSPGPIESVPMVRQLDPGFSGWLEFELENALDVVAGQAPLWLALRVTRGTVDWFCVPGASDRARVSGDRGSTWGAPDPALTAPGVPIAQLFHQVPGTRAAPVISLHKGNIVLQESLPVRAIVNSPFEYSCDTELPPPVHDLLAATPVRPRVVTELQLFSRSALDLSVDALQLRYDPFVISARAG